MIILGLSGKKLSGKNTVAEIIKKQLSHKRVMLFGFADALKEECAAMLGITIAQIEDNKIRYRGLLQWYGTEYRRYDNPNYWITRLCDKLVMVQHTVDVAIVTDVRFKNEAQALTQLSDDGAILVRVNRYIDAPGDLHASEHDLDHYCFDIELFNNGTFQELEDNINRLITPLLTT